MYALSFTFIFYFHFFSLFLTGFVTFIVYNTGKRKCEGILYLLSKMRPIDRIILLIWHIVHGQNLFWKHTYIWNFQNHLPWGEAKGVLDNPVECSIFPYLSCYYKKCRIFENGRRCMFRIINNDQMISKSIFDRWKMYDTQISRN